MAGRPYNWMKIHSVSGGLIESKFHLLPAGIILLLAVAGCNPMPPAESRTPRLSCYNEIRTTDGSKEARR
jgi:hypothetical protein